MKTTFLIVYLLLIVAFAKAQIASEAEPEKIVAQETTKQPFIYRIEHENPNVKLLIALSDEDIVKIENNIMEYEKQRNIVDRANKVYILNPEFEVKSVVEPEK